MWVCTSSRVHLGLTAAGGGGDGAEEQRGAGLPGVGVGAETAPRSVPSTPGPARPDDSVGKGHRQVNAVATRVVRPPSRRSALRRWPEKHFQPGRSSGPWPGLSRSRSPQHRPQGRPAGRGLPTPGRGGRTGGPASDLAATPLSPQCGFCRGGSPRGPGRGRPVGAGPRGQSGRSGRRLQ